MRALLLAGLLVAVAALSGCNSNGKGICGCASNEVCLSGRCFPTQQPTVNEPTATKASCPAFTQAAVTLTDTTTPQPAAGTCPVPVPDSSTPALVAAVTPAGAQPVGTSVSFTVPPNTAGFTIVLQGVSVPVTRIPIHDVTAGNFTIDNTAVPLTLTAPGNALWYDDLSSLQGTVADGSQQLVFFGSDSPLVGSLNVPNTTKGLSAVDAGGGLPAGTWTLVVNDYANECFSAARGSTLSAACGRDAPVTPAPTAAYTSGTYKTSVILHPGARPAQGLLNVGLYVHRCPGAAGYDNAGNCCASPPTNPATGKPFPVVDTNGNCTTRQAELTAAHAADPVSPDADAQRFVKTFASLLANGGVCLGTVTWYDLPTWAQTTWQNGLDLNPTTCDSSLEQLLALSQPHDAGQVNLFVMPDILATNTGSSRIVGIDGTIPGPATFSGTVQSGAAVSGADLRAGAAGCVGDLALSTCGADVTAYIAAHETGHYLGLYHTSESGGDAFDPLADTLPCECRSCLTGARAAQCGTSSAQVNASDCNKSTAACGGGFNLMFWLLEDTVSAGKVSPQQSQVLLSSPLLH